MPINFIERIENNDILSKKGIKCLYSDLVLQNSINGFPEASIREEMISRMQWKRQPERNAEDGQDSTRWRNLDARQRRLSSLGGKATQSWLNAQCSEDNKFGQLGGYRVPETKSRRRTKKLAANEENGDVSTENSIVFVNERCSNDFLEKTHVHWIEEGYFHFDGKRINARCT